MYQNAQRAPVDHKPRYESPKLCWCEDVDFKHGNWMWTDRSVPHAIDSKFWELVPDTRPQFMGELSLGFVFLENYQPSREQGKLVSEANNSEAQEDALVNETKSSPLPGKSRCGHQKLSGVIYQHTLVF